MMHLPLTKFMLVTLLYMEAESADAPTDAMRTKGNCTCITPDGAEYNLMPLRRTDGIPRFNVRSLLKKSVYFTYNPCTPVTLPEGSPFTFCNKVSLCRIEDGWLYLAIGFQGGVKCKKTRNGDLELVYNIWGDFLTSSVQLICDPKRKTPDQAVFQLLNEEKLEFGLIHRCACPNGCPSYIPNPSSRPTCLGKQGITPIAIFIPSIVALCALVALFCYCNSRHEAHNNGHDDERKPILEQGEPTASNQDTAFGVANRRQKDENDIGRARGDRVGYEIILREPADPRRGNVPRDRENVPVENSDEHVG